MSGGKTLRRLLVKKPYLQLNATKIIAIAFAVIILLGTGLLALPVASRSGISCGFRPALFTATSATCITGLELYDTWTQWSGFGQVVILLLIEIGGLGFMSAASVGVFLFRKKIGLRQRMVMAQALSLNDMESVVRIQKWVLLGSMAVQLAGALVLTLHFLPDYGMRQAVIWGVFHSVSAFCNAGIDIFGSIAPGQSVITFNNDPVFCITLMVLIVIGGLGFFVWEELARVRRFEKFSVYTKLVLITSGILIVLGAVLIMVLEWNNPDTLGTMTPGQRVLNSFFQSVTLRTAGFVSVDQALLTDAGKGVSVLLMLIGGSSGSTAGGIKTVTVVVLLMFLWARARGRSTVTAFRWTIPQEQALNAMTIASIMIIMTLLGGVVFSVISPVSLQDALYESLAALTTVGISAGVTAQLGAVGQLVMILFMYFGRVGILTISLGFLMGNKAEDRFRYAYTNLLIG